MPGPAAAAAVAPVHVSISGLPAAGLVTVQARTTDDQGRPWQSAAVFRASDAGTLNLATAVPVSGSYHTADAAGLLWSLRPAFTTSPDTAFATSRGFTIRLQVLTGGHVRATATLQRQLPVTTSTQTVRQDGFAATLYTSAAVRPGAPAVVVLGGYPGGEDIPVALGLAMSGYPALAVGYFDQPGLPQCQCSTPLEYFARAVSWLRAQPAGRGRPVVLYGASDGAQAALLTASYLPHLADAVVASSPTDIIHAAAGGTGPGWTFGGKPLEAGMLIPVTKIRIPLLMGDGGQDAVLGFRRVGQRHRGRTGPLTWPRAGHQPVLSRRRALLLRHAPVLPVLHQREPGRHPASQRPGHRAVLDPHDHLPQPPPSPRTLIRDWKRFTGVRRICARAQTYGPGPGKTGVRTRPGKCFRTVRRWLRSAPWLARFLSRG